MQVNSLPNHHGGLQAVKHGSVYWYLSSYMLTAFSMSK